MMEMGSIISSLSRKTMVCHYSLKEPVTFLSLIRKRGLSTSTLALWAPPFVESCFSPKWNVLLPKFVSGGRDCVYDVSLLLLFEIEDPRLVDAVHVKCASLAGVFVCNEHLLAV